MALGGGGGKIPPKKGDKTSSKSLLNIERSNMVQELIKIVPFILLTFSLITCYITNMYAPFLIMSNLFGFSVFTNLYMLYFSYKYDYCVYNKIALFTLIALNILNIVHLIFDITSMYHLYDQIISACGMLLIFAAYIKNKLKKE